MSQENLRHLYNFGLKKKNPPDPATDIYIIK